MNPIEMLEVIRYTAQSLGIRGHNDKQTMDNLKMFIRSQLGITLQSWSEPAKPQGENNDAKLG